MLGPISKVIIYLSFEIETIQSILNRNRIQIQNHTIEIKFEFRSTWFRFKHNLLASLVVIEHLQQITIIIIIIIIASNFFFPTLFRRKGPRKGCGRSPKQHQNKDSACPDKIPKTIHNPAK